ncbi:Mbov_0401 family ICE element transposase-like protein [Mesomycoplasma hyopneumoniae]|uniref:Mbov_0401 family ICE element transposase-like protein n=1 Tax=Mesomycoplasma hyopneumoniae TaxID=2099 RepID=UPI0015C9FB50|nr:hypothetical protein [Mesomycoplasma hyopneumoniae]NYN91724.1 hypothetical protein [Mesomycoplasma hyopneumoniae]
MLYTQKEKEIFTNYLLRQIKKEDKEYIKEIIKIPNQGLHSKIKRKLKTEYGKIEVSVNRYWKKISVGDENGEVIGSKRKIFYSKFFENLVQKGRTITNSLIKKVFNLSYEVKYGTGISRIFNKIISTSSVNLLLRTTNSNPKLLDFKNLALKYDNIHLAVDDCFHKIIENKKVLKIKNRMLVLYLGKENGKVFGKTNILEIRKTGQKGQNIYQLAQKIKEKIFEIYGKNLKPIIYGDGAFWIKNLSKALNGIYILDKFHLLKKLSDLFSLKNNNSLNRFLFKENYPQLYQKLLALFQEHQTDKVVENLFKIIRYLEVFLEKNIWLFSKIREKIEQISEFRHYIIRNFRAVNQLFTYKNFGSYTEAFVAGLVKFNIKIKYSTYSFPRFFNNLQFHHLRTGTNLCLI